MDYQVAFDAQGLDVDEGLHYQFGCEALAKVLVANLVQGLRRIVVPWLQREAVVRSPLVELWVEFRHRGVRVRLYLEHPLAANGHLTDLGMIPEAFADPHDVGVVVRYLDAQRGAWWYLTSSSCFAMSTLFQTM